MNCKKCGSRMSLSEFEKTAVKGFYKWICHNCGNKTIAVSRNVSNRNRIHHDFAMFLLLSFFIGVIAGYAWRCAQLAGM